jgi:uncharacterized protein YmfQ (DUF2313 family)
MDSKKIIGGIVFATAVFALPPNSPADRQFTDQAATLMKFSDRAHRQRWEQNKEELARRLKSGAARDFYRQELERNGYLITSVNQDKEDYVEYEVVKGDLTYEVQISIDKQTQKASKVAVAANLWTAEVTDQLLKGERKQVSKSDATGKNNEPYSDRNRLNEWNRGKDELARALKSGQERDFYRRELERLGYHITSVNQDKPNYMEYEVVKGDRSYEVEIDVKGNKATKVEISSNMWKAEATEKLLASNRKNAGR